MEYVKENPIPLNHCTQARAQTGSNSDDEDDEQYI
jgi:hypothetical protein